MQARLREVGDALGTAALVRSMETLGQAVVDMRGTEAADPRLVLEIALVRLARRESNVAMQSLTDRLDRLEARLADGGGAPRRRRRRRRRARRRAARRAVADAPRRARTRRRCPTSRRPRPRRSPPRAAGGKPPALGALRKAAGRGADAPPPPEPDAAGRAERRGRAPTPRPST